LDSSAKSRINEATIKASKKILFIDDDRTFKMVSLLKRGGWQNVAVIADVRRLDQEELVAADIIFCDVQGVGQKLSFAGEGLGLAKAIKQKYPDKKIVIYSAITGHDPFSDGFRLADDMLSKNAEFYEFEKTALDLLS
jgi:DNA-binding NarL/FixJ family response regulator